MSRRLVVGITGTRHGATAAQRAALAQLLARATEVHIGDCVGADVDAWRAACQCRCRTVGHPPSQGGLRARLAYDETRPPKGYLERNQDIVLESDVLIACPSGLAEVTRSGTWATVRYSRRTDVPRVIIWPDGSLDTEGSSALDMLRG